MAKRVCTDVVDPLQDVTRGFTHAAEFLSFISQAKGRLRFHQQVEAGNQFLILTGLYPELLKRRGEKGEVPDLEYYESFAQRAYCAAADNHLSLHGVHPRIYSAPWRRPCPQPAVHSTA